MGKEEAAFDCCEMLATILNRAVFECVNNESRFILLWKPDFELLYVNIHHHHHHHISFFQFAKLNKISSLNLFNAPLVKICREVCIVLAAQIRKSLSDASYANYPSIPLELLTRNSCLMKTIISEVLKNMVL